MCHDSSLGNFDKFWFLIWTFWMISTHCQNRLKWIDSWILRIWVDPALSKSSQGRRHASMKNTSARCVHSWKNVFVQGEDMKSNPEMGETAIQPVPAQTADLSISGLRFMSSPCMCPMIRTSGALWWRATDGRCGIGRTGWTASKSYPRWPSWRERRRRSCGVTSSINLIWSYVENVVL